MESQISRTSSPNLKPKQPPTAYPYPSKPPPASAKPDLSHLSLQKKLHSMHYYEPFTLESIGLIAHLLEDIGHATGKQTALEQHVQEMQQKATETMQQLLPLQKENKRLTKENSTLHLELIHQTESVQEKEREWGCKIKELETQLKEYEFVSTQKSLRLQNKDAENEKLREKIESLIHIKGNIKESNAEFMRNVDPNEKSMEITHELNSTEAQIASVERRTEKVVSDFHKEQVDLIESLQHQIQVFEERIQAQQKEIADLKEGIDRRNKRIEMLASRSSTTVARDDENKSLMDTLGYFTAPADTATNSSEQLTRQIDVLNEQVAGYEKKLKSAMHRIRKYEDLRLSQKSLHERLERSEELVKKYRSEIATARATIDRADSAGVKSIQQDKENKATRAEAQIAEHSLHSEDVNDEVEELRHQIQKLEQTLSTYEDEKRTYAEALRQSKISSKVSHDTEKDAKEKLAKAYGTIKELRAELQTAQSQLRSTEKELALQQATLARVHESKEDEAVRSGELRNQVQVLEEVCRGLRQDQDAWKLKLHALERENTLLQNQLEHLKHQGDASDTTENESAAASASATLIKHLGEERNDLRLEIENLRVRLGEQRKELEGCHKKINALEQSNKSKVRELDNMGQHKSYLNDRVQVLATENQSLQSKLSRLLPLEATYPTSVEALEEELRRTQDDLNTKQEAVVQLKYKIDEQRYALESAIKEKQAIEYTVENLTSELKQLQQKYNATDQELSAQRSEVSRLQVECSSLEASNKTLLRRNENYIAQNDSTIKEYQAVLQSNKALVNQRYELEQELNIAKEKIANMVKQSQNLTAKSRSKSDELQQLQNDFERLKLQNQSHHHHNQLLESQNQRNQLLIQQATAQQDTHTNEKNAMQDEVKKYQEHVTQLKTLLNEIDQDNKMLLKTTQDKDAELSRADETLSRLQTQLREVTQQYQQSHDQIEKVEALLQGLDRERDELQEAIDEKTEQLISVSQQNQKYASEAAQLTKQLEGSSAELETYIEQLNQIQQQNTALKQELSQKTERMEEAKQLAQYKQTEIVALADDLANMTRENQALGEECSRLYLSVQNLQHDIESKEEVNAQQAEKLRAQDIQVNDIMTTYRALCDEKEALQEIDNSFAQAKKHWITEKSALEEKLEQLVEQQKLLQQQNEAYEDQLRIYTHQINHLTGELQVATSEIESRDEAVSALQTTVESQSSASKMAQKEHTSLQHQALSSFERVNAMDVRMQTIVRERNELKEKLKQSSKSQEQLENVIATLRSQQATSQAVISESTELQKTMKSEIERLRGETQQLQMVRGPIDPIADTKIPGSEGGTAAPPSKEKVAEQLQDVHRECEELESKLAKQDETIKAMEDARSQFHQFAKKYEREIEKRDRVIEDLKSVNSPTAASPGSVSSPASHQQ